MNITGIAGIALFFIGVWGIITRKDIIKMIIAFSILDTGIHLVIISIGNIRGLSAPILDSKLLRASGAAAVVDPLPSALVLTAIVIGLAVTALMLTFAVKMYANKKSFSIDDYRDSAC